MKSFIITLLVGLGLDALLIQASYFGGIYDLPNLVDSTFIIGMIMFFLGIFMTTKAGLLFRGITFTFRKMFGRRYLHYTYYEYLQEKDGEKKKNEINGGPLIWSGLLMLVAATVLAYLSFYGLM